MSSSLMYCIGLSGGCVRQAMFAALSCSLPLSLLKMHKICIFSYKYAVFWRRIPLLIYPLFLMFVIGENLYTWVCSFYAWRNIKTSIYLRLHVLQIPWRHNHESTIPIKSTSSLSTAHTRKYGMASMRAQRLRNHYSTVLSKRASRMGLPSVYVLLLRFSLVMKVQECQYAPYTWHQSKNYNRIIPQY